MFHSIETATAFRHRKREAMIERICRARCRAGDNFCPPGGSAGRFKHDASRRYGCG